MNCVSTFITLCTIYRSEESTEKVPEPEADVGEHMQFFFLSLVAVAGSLLRGVCV